MTHVVACAVAVLVLLPANGLLSAFACHAALSDEVDQVKALAECNDCYLDICTVSASLLILFICRLSQEATKNNVADNNKDSDGAGKPLRETGRQQKSKRREKRSKSKSKKKSYDVVQEQETGSTNPQAPSVEELPAKSPTTAAPKTLTKQGGDLQEYLSTANATMAYLGAAVDLTDKTWRKAGSKSGEQDGNTCSMGRGVVPAPVEKVFYHMSDQKNRLSDKSRYSLMPLLKRIVVIEDLLEEGSRNFDHVDEMGRRWECVRFRVEHTQLKPIWPTQARDMVYLATQYRLEGMRTYRQACCSVFHPGVPVDLDYVRAHVKCTGWQVEPPSGSSDSANATADTWPPTSDAAKTARNCNVVSLTAIDMKGSLPKSLINSLASKRAMLPAKWSKVQELLNTEDKKQ